MFRDDQIKALEAKLDRAHVLKRKQGGMDVSYVPGWHVIKEANRIFGFDAWDRRTLEMRQLMEPYQVNGKWRVSYMARVEITVRAGETVVVRHGTGYGSGIAGDLGDAHESATKEACTDGLKRALMTFGNPFGLALYDKDQADVGQPETQRQAPPDAPPQPQARVTPEEWVAKAKAAIMGLSAVSEIDEWEKKHAAALERLKQRDPNLRLEIGNALAERFQAINAKEPANG